MDYTSAIAELLSRHGFRRFVMSRTGVGHLVMAGHLDDRPLDIVLDTGAGKTFVELSYCRSEGIALVDTGQPGTPAAGAGSSTASNVYVLRDARLTLEGLPVRSDRIFAIDMTYTNQKLMMRGVEPIRAVIGQDVLRYHQAVIDYAALALFSKRNLLRVPRNSRVANPSCQLPGIPDCLMRRALARALARHAQPASATYRG